MELTLDRTQSTPSDANAFPEEIARRALASHPHFRGRIDNFAFSQRGKSLVVEGRVPSYYLKQLVQCILARLDGVRRIENQIMVVSGTGVSSA